MARFNIDFFKNETPELAYILGLIASDGCIYKNSIQIALNDKDVIEWLARTIEYTGDIKEVERYGGFDNKSDVVTSIGYFIRITNKEVRQIFNSYGITEKKSKTIQFPKICEELLPHFIRGVFDGDGGIYVTKRQINGKDYNRSKVHFTSGSIEFLEGLKNNVERYLGNNVKITKGTRCFIYAFESKKDVIKFGEWIYQNEQFGMHRKKRKFIELGANVA